MHSMMVNVSLILIIIRSLKHANGFTVAIAPTYIPSLTPGGTLRFVYYMYLNQLADPTKGYKKRSKCR